MPSVFKIDRLFGIEWRTVGFYSPHLNAGVTVESVHPPRLSYSLCFTPQELALFQGTAEPPSIRATRMSGTGVGYLEQLIRAVGKADQEVIAEKEPKVQQHLGGYSSKYYYPEARLMDDVARSLGDALSKINRTSR
jgi:hypothetical protein